VSSRRVCSFVASSPRPPSGVGSEPLPTASRSRKRTASTRLTSSRTRSAWSI
jgi:hypothetical protein